VRHFVTIFTDCALETVTVITGSCVPKHVTLWDHGFESRSTDGCISVFFLWCVFLFK